MPLGIPISRKEDLNDSIINSLSEILEFIEESADSD